MNEAAEFLTCEEMTGDLAVPWAQCSLMLRSDNAKRPSLPALCSEPYGTDLWNYTDIFVLWELYRYFCSDMELYRYCFGIWTIPIFFLFWHGTIPIFLFWHECVTTTLLTSKEFYNPTKITIVCGFCCWTHYFFFGGGGVYDFLMLTESSG